MTFDSRTKPVDKLDQLVRANRLLTVAVAVLACATAGLLIALLWATSSFQNDGSLADAQVLCERAIEEERGTSVKLEYISQSELDPGRFSLLGNVTDPPNGPKFLCSVDGVTDNGGGDATVSLVD